MDLIIEHTQAGLRDTFRLMGAMMMLGGIGLMLVIARFRRIARRDIRQQRALEEQTRLWQQELAHVSRVSTMGELTASLAHDLSQPLTAIVTNAQTIKRMLHSSSPDGQEVEEALTDITQDGKRASQVIAGLRVMLKKEAPEHVSLDLNQAIREIVRFLRRDSVLRDLDIELELASQLPAVQGNRIQLQQVILNLVLNASEAMRQAGALPEPVVIQTAFWCQFGIAEVESGETSWNASLILFLRPSPEGWAWGSPSIGPSWRPTAAASGPKTMLTDQVVRSASPCRILYLFELSRCGLRGKLPSSLSGYWSPPKRNVYILPRVAEA